MINKEHMMEIVYKQLAKDMNCKTDDFEKEGFVFCRSREEAGRRPFSRDKTHFDMLTLGKSIVVSATDDIMAYVQSELEGKDRYEAYNMPFVKGNALYFLPDLSNINHLSMLKGYEVKLYEREDIPQLYKYNGFHNAINYDINHPRPDVLSFVAISNNEIAGIAGASLDCETMWQIGTDVIPKHRGRGLASALVNKLALEILKRSRIPYYGVAPCNIASQRTAFRAGLIPAWTCAYRGVFDGVMTQSPCG